MKKILSFIGIVAILTLIIWGSLRLHQERLDEAINVNNAKIEELKNENDALVKLSDSLLNDYVKLNVQMGDLERKADSLGDIAETLEMPCEHALELRSREVEFVRMALKKCKEAKTIQTTRVGLSEIKVKNQVKICSEEITIHKSDLKIEKRKSFFRGMGTGGLIIGILIILAL